MRSFVGLAETHRLLLTVPENLPRDLLQSIPLLSWRYETHVPGAGGARSLPSLRLDSLQPANNGGSSGNSSIVHRSATGSSRSSARGAHATSAAALTIDQPAAHAPPHVRPRSNSHDDRSPSSLSGSSGGGDDGAASSTAAVPRVSIDELVPRRRSNSLSAADSTNAAVTTVATAAASGAGNVTIEIPHTRAIKFIHNNENAIAWALVTAVAAIMLFVLLQQPHHLLLKAPAIVGTFPSAFLLSCPLSSIDGTLNDHLQI